MKLIHTELQGVYIIQPDVYQDQRGFFLESYNKEKFNELGIGVTLLQDNHSFSKESNVIRGLHYQINPCAQAKLIRVITGSIFDVVVDLRKDSSTYGQWISIILDDKNKQQLFIPQGFAHGFCTMLPNTHVMYKVDNYYSPEHERGIRWDDPDLAIQWPTNSPILSGKDKELPLLKETEITF
ncbi:dTDP-4-dehydrorhamnose 3,5-epimerase [Paenibacillus validus]|uniref:dTDP-4-dehydrorhamnose 3,5-epimerase n=1 Tax=Paenibacillus TaxID=44249 RepID=UPI000FDB746A|nr:dTDP-4-dehydrorhamnose 3,5-epimerase [Paenibacillus validus]MED4599487.1 dTDP-4-dehydrorhamnose 3,5-epimerase [Paenibacillus validus]MED4606717.1 dTDP-4-dehydrorhamnose 3,5-epimerase [Paenibacillus validus]